MDIILDKWQEEVMAAEGDILLCTGRRVGKTLILSMKAIDLMVKQKTPVVIVSLTEDQSMIIHFMALHYLEDKYPEMLDKRGTTLKRLTLTNGSVMITRPVGDTGDATRGFEGGILIPDEASRLPKTFWIAAKPILLTTGGNIWMASTPHGKQGYFWKKFKESYIDKNPDARFKTFYISSEEVINNRPISKSWTQKQRDGALRILKEDKKDMTELEYSQEYLGLFMEDLLQMFPDKLIEKCQVLDRILPSQTRGDMYLGVDVGGMGKDISTYEVIELLDGKLYHRDHQFTEKTLTTQVSDKIKILDEIWNFRKIFIDDGGMGFGVFSELLTNDKTKRKVVGINNASRPLDREEKQKKKILKEDLYHNLLVLMERGDIQLLKSQDIKFSLQSIQFDSEACKVFGKDTHIAEGLIRAAWCVKQKHLKFAIHYI